MENNAKRTVSGVTYEITQELRDDIVAIMAELPLKTGFNVTSALITLKPNNPPSQPQAVPTPLASVQN